MKTKESIESAPLPRILVLGGGFAGITAVRELLKRNVRACITLVSDKSYFEYYPALYRVASGTSPLDVCVSYDELFPVSEYICVLKETITRIDLDQRNVEGRDGVNFGYDYLVVALGSEVSFFDIPGLSDYAFRFKSIHEAMNFKNTIEGDMCDATKRTKENPYTISIAGAGPSGVELAGELSYLVKRHLGSDVFKKGHARIVLVEAGPRILGTFPEKASLYATERLRDLGVEVITNFPATKLSDHILYSGTIEMPTDRVVWTAGFKTNKLFSSTLGFSINKKGRVALGEYLDVPNFPNVFVLGDGSDTPFSGLAQTAIHQGEYIAKHIDRMLGKKPLIPYIPKPTIFVVPIGRGWGLLASGSTVLKGLVIWILRFIVDAKFMFSILNIQRALRHIFSRWL